MFARTTELMPLESKTAHKNVNFFSFTSKSSRVGSPHAGRRYWDLERSATRSANTQYARSQNDRPVICVQFHSKVPEGLRLLVANPRTNRDSIPSHSL